MILKRAHSFQHLTKSCSVPNLQFLAFEFVGNFQTPWGETMKIQRWNILIAVLFISMSQVVLAADFDEGEDVANESDAAMAETKEVKEQLAKEHAAAKRKHDAVKRQRDSAAAKRQAAVDGMRAIENQIQNFEKEQARMKTEIAGFEKETEQALKVTEEKKALAQKLKSETATLTQLKTEKLQKLDAMKLERDKVLQEQKEVEALRLTSDQDFQKLKDEEKKQSDALDKLKLELTQKKARSDAYLAELKERYRKSQEQLKAKKAEVALIEMNANKADAMTKTAEQELNPQIQDQPMESAVPAVQRTEQPQAVEFKRKCRVFDSPGKGPKVLATQGPGDAFHKAEEGKTWIAIQMPDGRKGYAAKGCFKAPNSSVSSL